MTTLIQQRIWDPHEGHAPEHLAFRYLSSALITHAFIFA